MIKIAKVGKQKTEAELKSYPSLSPSPISSSSSSPSPSLSSSLSPSPNLSPSSTLILSQNTTPTPSSNYTRDLDAIPFLNKWGRQPFVQKWKKIKLEKKGFIDHREFFLVVVLKSWRRIIRY